jgi:capsular polysaccharide transport system permease protein
MSRLHLGFVLFVLAPTIAAIAYYGFFVAPIYMSTAAYVVKDASQSPSASGLGQFLQSAGLATSANDAYAISAYISSRDALAELDKTINIRALYNRPEADFLAKFPNFYTFFQKSFEWLYWHYYWWIEVDFNTTTNITTIYAWAFRPDDAHAIAQKLLVLSENAVNAMNDKAHLDAFRAGRDEVNQLQQRATDIQAQITAFRDNELILNPNQTSTDATNLRMTLENALVGARALLNQLQGTAPSSPQIPGLKLRIKSLEDQVNEQEHKNSGGPQTLAPKISKYDALLLQQQFIQQMLQAAVSGLENAEVSAIQQTLYLQRVSEPSTPDSQTISYRIVNPLLIFITALLIYGTGRMVVSTVREHLS